MKIAIVYYSKTGKTRQMAEEMAKGMESVENVQAELFPVETVTPEDLDACAGVVFGTPTYYANLAWPIKKWFDEGHAFHLEGKLGAAFATANVPQGGADVAMLTLIGHMMVKGMLVYSGGSALGQPFIHLGAAAWRDTFEKDRELFHIFGERIAKKAWELFA